MAKAAVGYPAPPAILECIKAVRAAAAAAAAGAAAAVFVRVCVRARPDEAAARNNNRVS